MPLPPIRFFFNFPKTIFHQHLPFSVTVGISLRHILTLVWWESVATVTRYDVLSSRWSSHFWVKLFVFRLFLGEKSRNCTQKAVKCYIIIISYFTWLALTISNFCCFSIFWRYFTFSRKPLMCSTRWGIHYGLGRCWGVWRHPRWRPYWQPSWILPKIKNYQKAAKIGNC